MQSALERRRELLGILIDRREEMVENLAFEYGVTERTIRRDLEELGRYYPVFTKQGKGGGVYIAKGFVLGRKYLNAKQQELLERLSVRLDGDDLKTMKSILKVFSAPKIEN